jgi:folylpolyglutamate synthase/dihydropteroate synthase
MIAEPYLYKNIEVDECDDHVLLQLLFTLLARKKLAAYINSLKYIHSKFRLTQNVAKQAAKKEKLRSGVWKHRNTIGEKIDEILPPASGLSSISSWRLNWFSAIMLAPNDHGAEDSVSGIVHR